MSEHVFDLYESIVEDSWNRFVYREEFDAEELGSVFNPYLLHHYLCLVYVHHELVHVHQRDEKYKTLSKASGVYPELLHEIAPIDPNLVPTLVAFLSPSRRGFNTRQRLHYDLEIVFNDNGYLSGGVFSYVGTSAARRVNRTSVVGRLSNVNSLRRSRVGQSWSRYCARYLRQTNLYHRTMGFEDSGGFYRCPSVLSTICR